MACLPTLSRGGCAISGLFDLRPFPYTYLQPKLQLTWGEVLRNSPILHVPDEAPLLILTYGDEETPELRRQSDDFLAAWKMKGLRGEPLSQPSKDHFSAIGGFLDTDSPLCGAILELMVSDRRRQ
jgi:arylformamidase